MSLISSDGLSLDAPGTGWKSVGVDPLVVWSLATLPAGNSLEFLGEICTPGRLLWPRTRLLARSQEQSFELVFSKAKHWKFNEVIKVYIVDCCDSCSSGWLMLQGGGYSGERSAKQK